MNEVTCRRDDEWKHACLQSAILYVTPLFKAYECLELDLLFVEIYMVRWLVSLVKAQSIEYEKSILEVF